MENNQKQVPTKSLTDRIWDVFASVKLAVVIFSLIAVTSVVGTVLEQNADPEKNIKILVKMFKVGHDTAHSVYGVLDQLGFTDMYHSWWFVAFLLLFAANLIICSIDRLPRIWKLAREPIHPLSSDLLEKTSIRRSVTLRGKPAAARELVLSGLKEIGFKPAEAAPAEAGGPQAMQVYAEKGNYSRLGVYITHLSILIILAGAIIGVFFGYNGFLNLPEGETTSVAYKDQGKEIPLGFELRCDNFEVQYYGDSDMPKAYKSWLSVYKNGKKVLEKAIVVNDPLTYEGITFYQSSYGMIPNGQGRGIIILRLKSAGGQSQDIQARVGDSFVIPGTSVQGRIADFSPALSIDPSSGRPFSYDEQLKNPGVFIEFSGPGRTSSGWILKRIDKTWNLPDGNRVEFLDYWGVEYTGMQVRKDPGVGIVYLGCIVMSIGLFMSFFMSHRRIWVSIVDDKGGARIVLGASAHRNRAAFETRVDKLVSILSTGLKGGNK